VRTPRRRLPLRLPEYPYPDPIVQITDVQELARDLVVIPNRRVKLVPNIGVIAGTHPVLVIETGIGTRNASEEDEDDRVR
jgi:hypothetical protein